MATLVLTAVGTALGGPIGGAIGAIIGNQVDRTVLGSGKRQGPRLGDLSVQTSSYGSQIPRLFGTMRVAGTVIWATDLREDTHHSGGGKAGGSTTSYSYSASFAVALSARPILSVGRIWADGNLLRGAAGDWKSETGFRLYTGGEDQAVDPLIASAEGIAAAPAHRGIAYAVFEDLQLADFGNRIPSLTFEITADPGPVSLSTIAAELGGIAGGADAPALVGFAASGETVRSALETLAAGFPIALSDDGAALRFGETTTETLPSPLFGATFDGTRQPTRLRDRQAAAALPDALAVAYYEPARDYQAGLQRSRRDGIGRREERLDLPAALTAEEAKKVAEEGLARRWRERDTATVRVPWRLLGIRAGTQVMMEDGATWRVTDWTLDRMAIELRLSRTGQGAPIGLAEPGRAAGAVDQAAGATRLVLLDLPAADESAIAPQLWLAAAGTEPGWRRASVDFSLDGGASWQPVGSNALPSFMGMAATVLPDGPSTQFDRLNLVEIELLNGGMALLGADDAALIAGANLAMLGDELIQFGDAVQIGPGRFRLSRLLRGRRGSEWAAGLHHAGEPFVLLDPARLRRIEVPLSAIGSTLSIQATGPGDTGVAATASLPVVGRAVRPPAPVHLRRQRLADGTVRFSWVRRSRGGWAWIDGSDAPLGEDAERYRLGLLSDGGAGRSVETSVPFYDYPPTDQAADGVSADAITIELAQLGTRAASLPPAVTRNILEGA